MKCRHGDIVLVLFPNSDLRTAKRRPALVVQVDRSRTELSQRIVAMISSNMARAGHPSRVTVLADSPQGRRSGLVSDSVVMTDNLATVFEDELDKVIGRLSDMTTVEQALRHTFGL